MKKVSVIGHFGNGLEYLDGQTVKTKIVTRELYAALGTQEVLQFDTHGRIKTLISAPFVSLKALIKSKNVVIFPAQNGLRVFGRILPILRCFFKNRKIHYVVIGGWLPKVLETNKGLQRALKKFDGIYVETNTMKNALDAQGFENVLVMPNCKKLTVISKDELTEHNSAPYKLCTFSRVSREKGIEDAVKAIKAVNESLGYTAYSLDIFGQVDKTQIDWFDSLKASFPPYVRFGGEIPFDKSVETVKNYFALLFPTHYYTEGIPGTIIDAYAAGVPVISARWESYLDIVDEGVTGLGYELGSIDALIDTLKAVAQNTDTLNQMKESCLEHAKRFLPSTAVNILTRELI